jgi:sulfopyruvate decarboxylase TPP-binding subunit
MPCKIIKTVCMIELSFCSTELAVPAAEVREAVGAGGGGGGAAERPASIMPSSAKAGMVNANIKTRAATKLLWCLMIVSYS